MKLSSYLLLHLEVVFLGHLGLAQEVDLSSLVVLDYYAHKILNSFEILN